MYSFNEEGLAVGRRTLLGGLAGAGILVGGWYFSGEDGFPDFSIRNGTDGELAVSIEVVDVQTGDTVIDGDIRMAEGDREQYHVSGDGPYKITVNPSLHSARTFDLDEYYLTDSKMMLVITIGEDGTSSAALAAQ